jgi:uncharacterized ParB-like nuclease family protein
MSEIITSVSDLDDLDLDLESDGISEVTETATLETVSDVSDDDLVLDDLDTTTNQPAASNAQESDDLKLDESIDDLKLEDNITEAPVDKVTPELSKPKLNLDDEIELELDVNEGIKPSEKPATTEVPTSNNEQPASVEAQKKTRKPRTPKVKEPATQAVASVDKGDVTIVATGTGSSMLINMPQSPSKYLDPMFPIEKLDRSRYETRATVRSNEAIDELAEKIKLQGQKEPIHVYIDANNQVFLLAGFHRVEALEKLGLTTAEAYVHKNLSEAEIYKICTGTNEPRVQLTEWDKIVSVGKYNELKPEIPVDDVNNPESVVCVFGYSRSSVYNYIKFWQTYKDNAVLVDYFNKNGSSIPGYVYQILSKVMEQLAEYKLTSEEWVKLLDDMIKASNRQTFTVELITAVNNYMTEKKSADKLALELEKDIVDVNPTIMNNFIQEEKDKQPLIDKRTELNQKNLESEIKNLENEIELEKDSKQTIDGCYQSVILELTKTHSGLDCVLSFENYQELRNVAEVKKIKELACLIIEQIKKL